MSFSGEKVTSDEGATSDEEVSCKKARIEHQFIEPWDDSDVILVVEDEKFHVHSTLLGLASPVFRAMFSVNFREGREGIVNLPGKKKSAILTMLKLIYPIDFKLTEYSVCEELLELAREYDIKRVSQLVDYFINQDVDCSLKVLDLAERFALEKTQKKHIKSYIEACDTDKIKFFKGDWNNVSDRTKLAILSGKLNDMAITPSMCRVCPVKYCNHKFEICKKDIYTFCNAMKAFVNNPT